MDTAYAQSNVTIYGVVDTGYIKKTGEDVGMGENVNSRIGFKGLSLKKRGNAKK